MAEEKKQVEGPIMMCLTAVLKPPPSRMSSFGKYITFPVSVRVKDLLAAFVGALIGIVIMAPLMGGQGIFYGIAIGAAAGVSTMHYSPIKGLNFFQALIVILRFTASSTELNSNTRGKVYVGVCRMSRLPAGKAVIRQSAFKVLPENYDERGVLITTENENLPGTYSPRIRPFRPDKEYPKTPTGQDKYIYPTVAKTSKQKKLPTVLLGASPKSTVNLEKLHRERFGGPSTPSA